MSLEIGCKPPIPCHSKLYPLKSGYLATQLVHALSLFYVFKRRNSRYVASRLRGYAATRLRSYVATRLHRLKNELDSRVACSFRLMDYCFGTLIKERVKFLCSVLVSAQGLLSELWSSQLWMQFKQLRIEAWKSQDFNGVWEITRSRVQTPLKSWLFHNCDDHSSLDFKSAVQYMKHFIYHFSRIIVSAHWLKNELNCCLARFFPHGKISIMYKSLDHEAIKLAPSLKQKFWFHQTSW